MALPIADSSDAVLVRRARDGSTEAFSVNEGEPPQPSLMRLADGTVLERAESKLLVEQALAALPVEQREAIILKVYRGF